MENKDIVILPFKGSAKPAGHAQRSSDKNNNLATKVINKTSIASGSLHCTNWFDQRSGKVVKNLMNMGDKRERERERERE